jgi:hypothetical protein
MGEEVRFDPNSQQSIDISHNGKITVRTTHVFDAKLIRFELSSKSMLASELVAACAHEQPESIEILRVNETPIKEKLTDPKFLKSK